MISKNQDLDLHKFNKIERIDHNELSEVFKVEEQGTKNIYAAIISFIPINSHEEMVNFSHEINNNISINHPSVLKIIGYSPTNFENESKPVIVTEFAQNGSLSNIINLERHSLLIEGWNDTKKLITIYGIASGMTYLRANKVLNYDLNPQNILMDSMLLPKISNYELFQKIHKNYKSKQIESIYIAPEMFESESSNVYSFGLIVYVLLTAKIPFENLNSSEIYQKVVLEHHRPSFDEKISEAYKNLIERCWSQNPEKRPSFAEITNELETNDEFITESVEKDDFICYVDFIKQYMNGSDEKKVIKLDDFIHNKDSKTFRKVDIQCVEQKLEKQQIEEEEEKEQQRFKEKEQKEQQLKEEEQQFSEEVQKKQQQFQKEEEEQKFKEKEQKEQQQFKEEEEQKEQQQFQGKEHQKQLLLFYFFMGKI